MGNKKRVTEWGSWMALRVLLVEPDNSTRKIIAALLRKCNYRVAAVSDGLKAWEILKRRPHKINLTLAEVEVQSISGYALLNLIMEHEICRNIPAIMMSSEDSVNIVLKCMSKGAADFLIKPVRKNELGNLWQHVWRRKIQNTGILVQKLTAAQKDMDTKSGDIVMRNHSTDNLASAQIKKKCSNSASDLQSSCTTPYLEAESTCVPNMLGQPLILFGHAFGTSNIRRDDKCHGMIEKSPLPKSYSGANTIKSGLEDATCVGACNSVGTRSVEGHVCASTAVSADIRLESPMESSYNNSELAELPGEAVDLIGKFKSCEEIQNNAGIGDGPRKPNYSPKLELSLGGSYLSFLKDEGTEEIAMSNHSKASDFSRYGRSETILPVSRKSSGNFVAKNEAETGSHDSFAKQHPIFSASSFCGSLTSSHEDLNCSGQSEQTEAPIPGIQMGFHLLPRADGTSVSSIQLYPSVYYPQSNFLPLCSPTLQHEMPHNPPNSSIHLISEVCNLEPVLQPFHDGMRNLDKQTVHSNNKIGTVPATVNDCSTPRSSTLCSAVASNVSGKGCGSINEKGEINKILTPSVATATPSESVHNSTILHRDGPRETSSHLPGVREAALIKYRLKRKARCFGKKVRYQNRKRLAEQCPRVKGQFVRQVQPETTL